jgi:hypothetical protein
MILDLPMSELTWIDSRVLEASPLRRVLSETSPLGDESSRRRVLSKTSPLGDESSRRRVLSETSPLGGESSWRRFLLGGSRLGGESSRMLNALLLTNFDIIPHKLTWIDRSESSEVSPLRGESSRWRVLSEAESLRKESSRRPSPLRGESSRRPSSFICELSKQFLNSSSWFLFSIHFSGLAGFADFKSASRGQEPNSFLLEWTSESYTTIEEFELIWREDGGSWEGFSVPSHQINAFNWAGKHSFSGLNVATRYEARVTAKNEEGWSRPSPSYHFATFGAGKDFFLNRIFCTKPDWKVDFYFTLSFVLK